MNGNTRVGANLAFISAVLIGVMVFVSLPASADRYSSTNYTIDASTMNTFGGTGGSTSYGLVSSGGEAIIGNGTGGSYKLGQGYVAQLEEEEPSLSLFVQPSGLAGYWAFDENTGTVAADSTVNANDTNLVNGPTWGTGKLNSGIVFDGTNDYVNKTNPVGLPASNVSKSIIVWAKTTAAKTQAMVTMGGDNGNTSGFAVRLSNTGGTEVQVKAIGGIVLLASVHANVVDGNWHQIAYTYNATTHKLYFDGSLVDSSSYTHTVGNVNEFSIGASKVNGAGATEYWQGSLDEVKVFSRELSLAEIQAEYNAQVAASVNGVFIGSVVPGVSNTALYEVVTVANTTGYTLAAHQDADLTQGVNTIPAISGSIGTPLAWSEGTTKGLGFTLVSGSGIPGSWNSGNSYAAFPGSATTFYTRTGYTPGTKDILGMRLRLDVATTQPSGDYDNAITITGTTTP